jgi:hypothetical protein
MSALIAALTVAAGIGIFAAVEAGLVSGGTGRTFSRAVPSTSSILDSRGTQAGPTSEASPTSTTAPAAPTTTMASLPTAGLAGPWRQVSPGVNVGVFEASFTGPAVGVAIFDVAHVGFLWTPAGSVPSILRPALVAAFNGGFRFGASYGGWYADQRVGLPLRAGAASLVIYNDGTATVGQWGRDVSLLANVAEVRQNLTLLIDHGVLANGSPGIWGTTITHTAYTSRSGLGVDAAGRIIYAGGAGLDPASLARVLLAAGAIRAMELDINPEWVSLQLFNHGTYLATLLPSMSAPPFVSGFSRDFIAAFAR